MVGTNGITGQGAVMDRQELWSLSTVVLRAASTLVDGVQEGMRRRGYPDLRPAHGFAFSRVSGQGCTVNELGEHLGVSKQAASQMVAELEDKGYLERARHPGDGRAVLVTLSVRGRAATRAAEASAADSLRGWASSLSETRLRHLHKDLATLAGPGPLRPTW